jgi:hypothetical protein
MGFFSNTRAPYLMHFIRWKYMIVPTENIAFFYLKYKTTILVSLDRQEYSLGIR